MSRYAQDILIWIGISSGAFLAATVLFYWMWRAVYCRLRGRQYFRKIHIASGICLAVSAVIVNVLLQAFGIGDTTLLWKYIISPFIFTLPIVASYIAMTIAFQKGHFNGADETSPAGNRRSAPRQPSEGPPPAKPGAAPQSPRPDPAR